MNFTHEEIQNITMSQQFSDDTAGLLLEDIREVIRDKAEYDINALRLEATCLAVASSNYPIDYNDLFEIVHEFRLHVRQPRSIAYVEYSFMALYMKLGFAPKVIDHALNALSTGACTTKMYVSIYSQLAVLTKEYGLYDKALEYTNKVIEYTPDLDMFDPVFFPIINEDNLCCILCLTDRHDELHEHKQKLTSLLAEYADNVAVKSIIPAIDIDLLMIESIENGFSDAIIREYITKFGILIETTKEYKAIFSTAEPHVLFLKAMLERGYVAECINTCRTIIDSTYFMVTDYSELYGLFLKARDIKPDLISDDEYHARLKSYIEVLELDRKQHHDVFAHLVNEEYRIREVNSRYDLLKVQYETDALTVCYNRPSFELNASDFFKEHPDGSLVFIDIDNLKHVNDSFGHASGDLLLQSFVSLANNLLEEERDRIYRYAGDEFIIITSRDASEAGKLIDRMNGAYAAPITSTDGHEIHIEFSYGIASFSEVLQSNISGSSFEHMVQTAVQLADDRMYACKRTHKNARR